MSRWQRFKHAFETCRGRVVRCEYFPPKNLTIKGQGYEGTRLVEEARYGVTLVHCRCDVCGKDFTNRELGDARPDDAHGRKMDGETGKGEAA